MIVGLNFTSLNGSFDENQAAKQKGPVQINVSTSITSVEKKNTINMGELIAIKFKFDVVYDPEIAEIKMEGEVLYKDDSDSIIKKWKKEKKLELDLYKDVNNVIYRYCLVKAHGFAEDLRVPTPLRFPEIRAEDMKNKQKQ